MLTSQDKQAFRGGILLFFGVGLIGLVKLLISDQTTGVLALIVSGLFIASFVCWFLSRK